MNAVVGCSAVDPLFWKLPALVTQLNFLKFIHPADWLRLAATRTRPHEWRRAARRFEGHDIGYFYPGLAANGILHQITRPSLRNLHQTFFRTIGIRREMNKTRYIYNLPRRRPPSSFSSLLVVFSPPFDGDYIHFFLQSTLLLWVLYKIALKNVGK